jgi:hypothetical protein
MAAAKEEGGMKMFLLWLFIVLQYADALTTLKILERGGKELNPALRWLFDYVGVMNGIFIAKTVVVLVFWVFIEHIPVWAFVIMCGLCAAVVYHNIEQLRK